MTGSFHFWLCLQSPLDAFAREVVEALKAKGTLDWQQADEQGRTPLHHAAKANNAFIVRAAVKEGKCDVNAKESSGRTPLTYAAEGAATAAMKVRRYTRLGLFVGDVT